MTRLAVGLFSLLVVLATSSYSDLINPITLSEIFGEYRKTNNNNHKIKDSENPCITTANSINNVNNCNDDDNINNNIIDNNNLDENKLHTTSIFDDPDKYDWFDNVNDDMFEDIPSFTLPETQTSVLLTNKRNDATFIDQDLSAYSNLLTKYPASCACATHYEPHDLGYTHFPRYLVKAVCTNRHVNSLHCWHGSRCKEIPYKVHVLTHRQEQDLIENDHSTPLLPDALRKSWKFKTITISASCQCAT